MKILDKELITTIKQNFKRYLSIIVIIFLGVTFFVGMRSNSSVFQKTMRAYLNEYNYGDIKIASEIGLTKKEIQELKKNIPEIENIEGKYFKEVILHPQSNNKQGNDAAVFVHSYSDDYKINKIEIIEGKKITKENECLVGPELKELGFELGDRIFLSDSALKNSYYKIVGFARDPQYISYQKGVSSLLGSTVNYVAYVDESNFNTDNELYNIADIKIKKKYNEFTKKYNNYIANTKSKIQKKSKTIGKKRKEEVLDKTTKDLAQLEDEYNKRKAEVDQEIQSKEAELATAEQALNEARISLLPEEEIDAYLASLKNELDSKKEQLNYIQKSIDASEYAITQARSETGSSILQGIKLGPLRELYDSEQSKLREAVEQRDKNEQELRDFEDACSRETGAARAACDVVATGLRIRLEEQIKLVTKYQQDLDELDEQMNGVNDAAGLIEVISHYEQKLRASYLVQITQQYNDAEVAYNTTYVTLKEQGEAARNAVAQKEKELESSKATFETQKKEASEQLEKAYDKIIEGKKLLQRISNYQWDVFTRDDSYGYGTYYEDTVKIDQISKVFPLLFFAVAALVTATSITRMIQEEREKIGILKSLGCSNKQITLKYIRYSLSAAIIGSVLGIIVGLFMVPSLLAKAYELRYFIPKIKYVFHFSSVIISLILAYCSTTVVAVLASKNTASATPAVLMRKKKMKNVNFYQMEWNNKLWRKLSTLKKVTYRNIIENPLRSVMTIIGIAGCSALVISGFGVRESVKDFVNVQFNKIYNIDSEFYYKPDVTQYEIEKDYEEVNALKNVENASLSRRDLVKINSKKSLRVYTLVPHTLEDFEADIHLYSTISGSKISLKNQNGVVITEKLAKTLDLKPGDSITFMDSSNISHKAVITDIAENYLFDYIFMNEETYKQIYDYDLKCNYLAVKYTDRIYTQALSNKIYNRNNYSGFLNMEFHIENNQRVIKSLDVILCVILISAGLLAFIVLYNITKISISEKETEIATLRVMGYPYKWVYKYSNYEINILKYIGIVIGIFLGYFMTDLVITACELDFMMFYHGIIYVSYVYGVILTLIFSFIISRLLRRDVRNINMAQALKVTEE